MYTNIYFFLTRAHTRREVDPPSEIGPLSPFHSPNMPSWRLPPQIGPQTKHATLAPGFPSFMSQVKLVLFHVFTAQICDLAPPPRIWSIVRTSHLDRGHLSPWED